MAGQGAIYVRLKHGFGFLLDNQGSDNISLTDGHVNNHTESGEPISTLQQPQHPQAGSSHTQSTPMTIPQGPQAGGNHTQSTPVSTQGPQADSNHTHNRPVSTSQPIEGPQEDNRDDLFPVTRQQ